MKLQDCVLKDSFVGMRGDLKKGNRREAEQKELANRCCEDFCGCRRSKSRYCKRWCVYTRLYGW